MKLGFSTPLQGSKGVEVAEAEAGAALEGGISFPWSPGQAGIEADEKVDRFII